MGDTMRIRHGFALFLGLVSLAARCSRADVSSDATGMANLDVLDASGLQQAQLLTDKTPKEKADDAKGAVASAYAAAQVTGTPLVKQLAAKAALDACAKTYDEQNNL